MAIEIISRGKVPEEKVYEVRCDRCLSLLRCKRSDLSFTPDGRNGTDVSLKCPVCNYVHFLLRPLECYEVQPTP